ncbi:replication-associated recombination protein A [Acinetobacter pittii]|uniref:replication-associated recombination protein A n=1 Tax=Acinetobacter pittii TaxID=48296 RepID=UPI00195020B8|nr:replication-associated recombination protein A [Acinetobacter pittii]QRQ11557.1 replication-associated recombination protein A [Acinetobacter pittii]
MYQNTLFSQDSQRNRPLAIRMRPNTLSDFVGQSHLLGKGKILRDMIEQDSISSMIFWGAPGIGKTTLAEIIAKSTKARIITFSAVTSGIKDIKKIMEEAELNRQIGQKTLIFVDEIHRFNKAQQDVFLPYVEKGSIILIGATTENPSFEVNAALLSRAKVFVLESLSSSDIMTLLTRTLSSPQGLAEYNVKYDDSILLAIANFANGDARTALNTLEMAVINGEKLDGGIIIREDHLYDLLNRKSMLYDKNGEEHYNIISALHKSMRNSDTDSAIYWLARMLEGGEDPVYIARRLIRFASEDIGLADCNALNLTVNVFQSCQMLGMPECDVHLTQAVTYLSLAPKSNAIYQARLKVLKDIKNAPCEPVPLHLRNAPTKLMKEIGFGKGYQLAHHYTDKTTAMQTMPTALIGHRYYFPTNEGDEKEVNKRIHRLEYLKRIER